MAHLLRGLVELSSSLALDMIASAGNIAENGESMARTMEKGEADKRVLVEETAMLRASLVSVAGALTEALHKGDSDATRLLIVREGSEAEIDALYKEAIHLQDDKAEKDLMALDHRTAALIEREGLKMSLETEFHTRDTITAQLRDTVEELYTKNDALVGEITDSEAIISKLMDAKDTLGEKIASLLLLVEKKDDIMEKDAALINSLKSDKQALEQTLHDLRTAHTDGQQASAEELQNASAMVDKVKAQLGKAYATIKSLKDELASSKASEEEALKKSISLESEKGTLAAQLEKSLHDKKALEKDLHDLQAAHSNGKETTSDEVDKIKTRLDKANSTIQALRDELKSEKASKEDGLKKVAQLKAERDAAVKNAEVEARKASVQKGVMDEQRAKLTSKDKDQLAMIAKLEEKLKSEIAAKEAAQAKCAKLQAERSSGVKAVEEVEKAWARKVEALTTQHQADATASDAQLKALQKQLQSMTAAKDEAVANAAKRQVLAPPTKAAITRVEVDMHVQCKQTLAELKAQHAEEIARMDELSDASHLVLVDKNDRIAELEALLPPSPTDAAKTWVKADASPRTLQPAPLTNNRGRSWGSRPRATFQSYRSDTNELVMTLNGAPVDVPAQLHTASWSTNAKRASMAPQPRVPQAPLSQADFPKMAETTQGTAPSKRPTTQPSHTHTTSATLNFIAQSANNHGAKQSSGKKAWGHHGRS